MKNQHTKSLAILTLSILILGGTAAETLAQDESGRIEIVRSVDLREGPGSYYNLILRLKEGAEARQLMLQEGWMEVRVDAYRGWMPDHTAYYRLFGSSGSSNTDAETAQSLTNRMSDMFSQLSGSGAGSDSAYVLPAQVAAAVKGFARKYKTDRRQETNVDFTRSFENRINARDYRQFRRERISMGEWSQARQRFPLSEDTVPEFTPDVEQMGWAIASTIAANEGLVENYELQKYLNYVAYMVTESSHRYEIPVQVHILDTDDVVGYATPNGIIFVSRGVLNLIQTEAELAFFIGHELAHVTLQHGIQETEDRRTKIDSDRAFAELDQDLEYDERQDDEYVQVSQDLTAWTDQVYEYIISDKLEAYEHEADYWGMVYAWRAGYNPMAALNLLRRFQQDVGDFETQIGELKWQGTSLGERLIRCTDHIEQMHANPELNNDFEEEYRAIRSR